MRGRGSELLMCKSTLSKAMRHIPFEEFSIIVPAERVALDP